MENQDQNSLVPFEGSASTDANFSAAYNTPLEVNSLSATPGIPESLSSQERLYGSPLSRFFRLARRLDVMLVALLLVSAGVALFVVTRTERSSVTPSNASEFETIRIPLESIVSGKDLTVQGSSNVTINGQLQLGDALYLVPSLQPTGAKAGQIYFDSETNQLAYFNGKQFIFLTSPSVTPGDLQALTRVESIGGLSGLVGLGSGLALSGSQLTNTGVLAVQGQSGAVTLTAGPGIVINGTNFSNSGIISISAGSPNITVNNDGNGNVTIDVAALPGSGTVTSSGGTAGAVPVFTGSQNIEDSIITQSGMTVTISGDLSVVTGGLTLSNALTVSNGGTGAASLAANGVLVGNGTAAISSVTAGGAGLCLLSTAGTPAWAACPSSSGVNSLNGLTGALNIANASAAGSTITLDDASTSTKGIASFNSTNFSVSSGAVNTVQNIHSTATPTFTGVNTNTITPSAALTLGISAQTALLQGSTTTITSNGAGNNIVLNSAATIELQDDTNVSGSLAATGDVAVNGGDITSTGVLNITPGGALTVGASSQTLTLQGGATTSFRATSGANTTIIGFASPTANTTLNFPALTAGTYTICTTSGNCAGAAVTLQSAYDNSSNPEIVLDATRGALTIRDNATPLGANLLEVQSNDGTTTYLAVTTSGVAVTGTATVTGHVNSSGGALQTNGTSRIDNSGNLVNIANLTLTGAISGGTSLSLSGSISGGTTITGSGNINTTAGALQTNGTTRVDNSGNLINIAAITASGNATLQGGTATLGTNAQAASLVLNDGSSNTGTLQVAALGQNTTYTLPDPGGTTASICLSTGNCAGSGGGVTTSGGTNNRIAKFTGAQTLGDSSISDDGTNITVTVDVIIQGGDLTVGTAAQRGSVLLHDGNGQTTTLQAGDSTGNITFILPTGTGSANQCLKQSGVGSQLVWQDCDGGAGGSSATLQTAYDNSITNPEITLNGSVGAITIRDNSTPIGSTLFNIQNNLGTTNYLAVTVSGIDVTGTADISGNIDSTGGNIQTNGTSRIDNSGNLVNIGNLTASGALTIASVGAGNDVTINGADQFIVQDVAMFNAATTFNADITLGTNDIIGTTGDIDLSNFDVAGATGNVTAGTFNGQTISSSANFTGTVAVAGNTTLTGDVAVNGGDITSSGALNITPGGVLTIGATGQQLVLQGNASTQLTATGGGFTTTVGFTGTPTGAVIYNFDRAAAAGTYNICTSIGNCAGAGSGVTTSGGTVGTLAKFTGAQVLGDSLLSESGGVVTVNGHLNLASGNQFRVNGTQISSANLSNDANLAKLSASQTFTGNTVAFQNSANSANAFNVQTQAGARVLTVDTTGGQVLLGVGSSLDGKLVFSNISNANTVTILPGTPTNDRTLTLPDASGIICTDSGNCAGAGATLQTAYNFSTGGTTPKIKVNSSLLGVDIQDADTTIGANLFNIRASNGSGLGSVMFGVSSSGQVTAQNAANSTSAFRLLTQGGTSVLTGDTQNGLITLGQSGTLSGSLVFSNATNSNTVTISAPTATAARTISFGDESGTVCLRSNSNCGFATATGSTSYIHNQSASDQSADFRITGTGRANTSFLAPLFDTATAIDLEIGTNTATAINLNQNTVIGSGKTLTVNGAATFNANINFGTNNLVGTTGDIDLTNFDVDGATGDVTTAGSLTVNTSAVLGDAAADTLTINATLQGGSLIFEGSSADANETTFAITNPTADRTIIFADEDGTVCMRGNTNCNFAAESGDADYIQNGTTVQAANFYVQAAASGSIAGILRANAAGTGDILNLRNGADTNVMVVSSTGAALFQNASNSVSAFAIQNANADAILTVDTSNSEIELGKPGASGITGRLVFNNAANSNTLTLQAGTTTAGYTLTLPTAVGASGDCLKTSDASGTLTFGSCAAGGGTTLQGAYTASTGSTTPEILLDTTRNAVDIQDANTTIGSTIPLFAVRASATSTTLGNILFDVQGNGRVGLQLGSTTSNVSYDVTFGNGANRTIGVANSASGAGRDLTLRAGDSQAGTSSAAGNVVLQGGNQSTGGATITTQGGINDVNNITAGDIELQGGNSGALIVVGGSNQALSSVDGGSILLQADSGSTSDGNVLVKNLANSTSAFQVQNTSANGWVLNVDTSNNEVELGRASTVSGTLVFASASNAFTAKITSGATSNYTLTLPTNVGASGDCLKASNGTGGLTFGSCGAGATPTLQDAYVNDSSGEADITTTSSAKTLLFKAGATFDSANLFHVQNAGGADLFIVDSTNSRIQIGSATADSTGVILVLDTKNTTGDPTGANGGMYYNSALKKFRCYEDSVWLDCVGESSERDRRKPFYSADFMQDVAQTTTQSNDPWFGAGVASGTAGAPTTGLVTGEHPGVVRLRSSNSGNAGYRYTTGVTMLRLAGGETTEMIFNPDLLDFTDLRFGFLDTTSSTAPTDGAYVEVPSGSAALSGKTVTSGTSSTTGTSYTLSVNTWYRVKIMVNSNASRVDFYLYDMSGTQLWTNNLTTNIPTAQGNETGHGLVVTYEDPLAIDLMHLDYMALWWERTFTR